MLITEHKFHEPNRRPHISRAVQIVSLFSGSGGLDLGFEQEGFVPVLATDVSEAACATYSRNRMGRSVNFAMLDLETTDPRHIVDLVPTSAIPKGVIGGPPCQAFSAGNVHQSASDPRLDLPNKFARLIHEINREYALDFFVFENVIGLNSRKHSEHLRSIKSQLVDAGFRLFEAELDAANFGVPQHRRRYFIIGLNAMTRRNTNFDFPAPTVSQPRTVREAIENLPEAVLFDRALTPEIITSRTGHPNHWTMRPKSAKFRNINNELVPGKKIGRAFRVLEWDQPSFTVAYGNREIHIHPSMKRRLTVYEALLLQGFPKNYELSGNLSQQVRLVSDAVPPPLAKAVANAIMFQIYGRSASS